MTTDKVRLSEVYLSMQGEGPRVGHPTVFVRFAGCNLRCAGWPCDTPHAIFPEKYRDEWKIKTVDEAVSEIDLIADKNRQVSICYTGGEPFLQNHTALEELSYGLEDRGYEMFEAFTNGTILYPDWAFDLIHFIMDWKLPGSGESPYNSERVQNAYRLSTGDAIKFVVKDRTDYELAIELWDKYLTKSSARIYMGVVWDELDPAKLVEWMLEDKLPFWLNLQSHQYVWPPNERRR
jgi:7-carboxy-7-deazaguanine synthase